MERDVQSIDQDSSSTDMGTDFCRSLYGRARMCNGRDDTNVLRGDQRRRNMSTDPARHFTDSKVLFAHAETEELLTPKTDQYGTDARVFTMMEQVINRWTTLPLPTKETWLKALEQDPDLRRLKTALQNKQVPPRAQFTNTKYHTELKSERLLLEDGLLYQLEQPKATRIRQL
jgi:hypothetical protein